MEFFDNKNYEFNTESKDKNSPEHPPEIPERGMAETVMNGHPPFKRYLFAQKKHEKDRKSHDSKTANLNQGKDNNLSKEGKFSPRIDHNQTSYAYGGCGRKEGIDKRNMRASGAHRQPEKNSTHKNRQRKSQQEIMCGL